MLELTRSPKRAEDAYQPGDGREGWLEVYGETKPTVSSGTGTPPVKGVGLYEYRWALGYLAPPSSHPAHGKGWLRGRPPEEDSQDSDQLADPAAHVYLFFLADCNWRVSEILATIKHLAPVQDERTWREELAKDFAAIQPVIGAAGQVAADATGMPELGSIAETVSRLKLTNVPPAPGAEWFVRKVDMVKSDHLFHGIEWQLSLSLLSQLGSRITGGLLVSFASVEARDIESADPSPGLLAKAVLHYVRSGENVQDVPIPAKKEPEGFLELPLAPH
jgi:hypothetical protein